MEIRHARLEEYLSGVENVQDGLAQFRLLVILLLNDHLPSQIFFIFIQNKPKGTVE